MATRWRRNVSCRSAPRRADGGRQGEAGRPGGSRSSSLLLRETAEVSGDGPALVHRAREGRHLLAHLRQPSDHLETAARPCGRAAGRPRARAPPGRGRPRSAARRPGRPRRPAPRPRGPRARRRPAARGGRTGPASPGPCPRRAASCDRARSKRARPARTTRRLARRPPTGLAVASRMAVIAATLFPRTRRRTPRCPRSVWQAAHSMRKTSAPAAASSAARSSTGRPSNPGSPGRQAAGATAHGEVARTPRLSSASSAKGSSGPCPTGPGTRTPFTNMCRSITHGLRSPSRTHSPAPIDTRPRTIRSPASRRP